MLWICSEFWWPNSWTGPGCRACEDWLVPLSWYSSDVHYPNLHFSGTSLKKTCSVSLHIPSPTCCEGPCGAVCEELRPSCRPPTHRLQVFPCKSVRIITTFVHHSNHRMLSPKSPTQGSQIPGSWFTAVPFNVMIDFGVSSSLHCCWLKVGVAVKSKCWKYFKNCRRVGESSKKIDSPTRFLRNVCWHLKKVFQWVEDRMKSPTPVKNVSSPKFQSRIPYYPHLQCLHLQSCLCWSQGSSNVRMAEPQPSPRT